MQERADSFDHRPARRPIVLTTDFGLADPFVGVMKGVVLGINPQARLIDLTHQIQPQNVLQGAFVLGTSYRFFPPGTIHVVVVDPGVGTSRRALLLTTPRGWFVAPDNGVLSYVLQDLLDCVPEQGGMVTLPAGLEAFSLTNPRYWLQPVSSTFHGRDIFAPVAAHLSLGVAPREMGEPVPKMACLPLPRAIHSDQGGGQSIEGEVIIVDHFGNLVTNIPSTALLGVEDIQVTVKGHRISGLSRTFQQTEDTSETQLVALLGSNGYLEIALPNGSAAGLLAAGTGETVRVTMGARA